MYKLTVSKNIQILRAYHGLTQAALAERAGLSVPTIHLIEKGTGGSARLDTLSKIGKVFDLAPTELLQPIKLLIYNKSEG